MSPIPWTAIKDYAEAYDITGEQREDLFYHIRRMDQAYIKYLRAKDKRRDNAIKSKKIKKARSSRR